MNTIHFKTLDHTQTENFNLSCLENKKDKSAKSKTNEAVQDTFKQSHISKADQEPLKIKKFSIKNLFKRKITINKETTSSTHSNKKPNSHFSLSHFFERKLNQMIKEVKGIEKKIAPISEQKTAHFPLLKKTNPPLIEGKKSQPTEISPAHTMITNFVETYLKTYFDQNDLLSKKEINRRVPLREALTRELKQMGSRIENEQEKELFFNTMKEQKSEIDELALKVYLKKFIKDIDHYYAQTTIAKIGQQSYRTIKNLIQPLVDRLKINLQKDFPSDFINLEEIDRYVFSTMMTRSLIRVPLSQTSHRRIEDKWRIEEKAHQLGQNKLFFSPQDIEKIDQKVSQMAQQIIV